MSDSGRTISRPEDGLSYYELEARVRELEAENALLKQQLRDATCSPQFATRLVHCILCGVPVVGKMADHVCLTAGWRHGGG